VWSDVVRWVPVLQGTAEVPLVMGAAVPGDDPGRGAVGHGGGASGAGRGGGTSTKTGRGGGTTTNLPLSGVHRISTESQDGLKEVQFLLGNTEDGPKSCKAARNKYAGVTIVLVHYYYYYYYYYYLSYLI
jgi:hypothetical protein